ncbi:hypothetical protein B0A55_09708 [Friedmanniomyces simplex]|uniref:Uncharacterized protein n=1 Tax=Friedmanniomyces simplex TaxID=329884 RepID=A0A4U0WYG2_9PEZI|nr:hypothetical protein B0A55_09708 [Friedmanniomyces simplex]
MMLSTYRNPPYRTPIPKGKSLSPPPGPSPKRKRTESHSAAGGVGADPVLQINIAADVTDGIPETPADSPYNTRVVVERLRGLNISQPPETETAAGERRVISASPRKRLKRNPHLRAPDIYPEQDVYSAPESSSPPVADSEDGGPLEISETPEWRRTRLPSSPAVPVVETQPRAQGAHVIEPIRASPAKAARFVSPPPPGTTTPRKTGSATDSDTSSSPTCLDEETSIDRITLTWQINEITGQDIDTTSPDDDGEGINGIGFKPTAAMAYARSQRRKQQVNEWKVREAREARQRRIERRRGAAVAAAETKEGRGVKRSVRFEGVG